VKRPRGMLCHCSFAIIRRPRRPIPIPDIRLAQLAPACGPLSAQTGRRSRRRSKGSFHPASRSNGREAALEKSIASSCSHRLRARPRLKGDTPCIDVRGLTTLENFFDSMRQERGEFAGAVADNAQRAVSASFARTSASCREAHNRLASSLDDARARSLAGRSNTPEP